MAPLVVRELVLVRELSFTRRKLTVRFVRPDGSPAKAHRSCARCDQGGVECGGADAAGPCRGGGHRGAARYAALSRSWAEASDSWAAVLLG